MGACGAEKMGGACDKPPNFPLLRRLRRRKGWRACGAPPFSLFSAARACMLQVSPSGGECSVVYLRGLNQLTWSNSSKWARLPGFAQSWASLPGFAKFWTRLPGPLNLHRSRLPGSSNLRVRLPGLAKLWTRLPGKRNVRTRLPRPQFCKSGPGYLVDQITWSRPKVGQITWSRPAGRREMAFGRPGCFWPL